MSHLRTAAALPVIGALVVATPALAQREVFEPQFAADYKQLEEETEQIISLQHELEGVTDVVRGCELLRDSLGHMQEAERLLVNLEDYAVRLSWRRQRDDARHRLELIRDDIKLKEGDIATYCSS
jgi:hypothetical protein